MSSSISQLKDALRETLERKKVLSNVRAQIRASVFHALDDKEAELPTISIENKIINNLILEYLAFNGYKHSLGVLEAETGTESTWDLQRAEIAKIIGLDLSKYPATIKLIQQHSSRTQFDADETIHNRKHLFTRSLKYDYQTLRDIKKIFLPVDELDDGEKFEMDNHALLHSRVSALLALFPKCSYDSVFKLILAQDELWPENYSQANKRLIFNNIWDSFRSNASPSDSDTQLTATLNIWKTLDFDPSLPFSVGLPFFDIYKEILATNYMDNFSLKPLSAGDENSFLNSPPTTRKNKSGGVEISLVDFKEPSTSLSSLKISPPDTAALLASATAAKLGTLDSISPGSFNPKALLNEVISNWKSNLQNFTDHISRIDWTTMALINEKIKLKDLEDLFVFYQRERNAAGSMSWEFEDYFSGRFGNRVVFKERSPPYATSHIPVYPSAHYTGAIHVSINFNDLSAASIINFLPDVKQCLFWIGIESNPYNVAKSLIILEMCTNGEDTEEILQVWHSTSWSKSTYKTFKETVKKIIRSIPTNHIHIPREEIPFPLTAGMMIGIPDEKKDALYRVEVQQYLLHWYKTFIPVLKAWDYWSQANKEYYQAINLKTSQDRVAVVKHLLTGHITMKKTVEEYNAMVASKKSISRTITGTAIDESYDSLCGNVMMFCEMNGRMNNPSEADLPTIFSSAPLHEIVQNRGKTENIVQATHAVLLKRIESLKTFIECKILHIEIKYDDVFEKKIGANGAVEYGNQLLINEIKSWNPKSISWGTTPDFIPPEVFHDIARKCSGKHKMANKPQLSSSDNTKREAMMNVVGKLRGYTVHKITTLKWTADIKGSAAIDYFEVEKRGESVNKGKTNGMGGANLTPKQRRIKAFKYLLEKFEVFSTFASDFNGSVISGGNYVQLNPKELGIKKIEYILKKECFKEWVEAWLKVGDVNKKKQWIADLAPWSVFNSETP
ncbi:hypothetical protein HK098_002452, partial [Nowakowskiella sp. JEL0407]